jgi:hypothetical protein
MKYAQTFSLIVLIIVSVLYCASGNALTRESLLAHLENAWEASDYGRVKDLLSDDKGLLLLGDLLIYKAAIKTAQQLIQLPEQERHDAALNWYIAKLSATSVAGGILLSILSYLLIHRLAPLGLLDPRVNSLATWLITRGLHWPGAALLSAGLGGIAGGLANVAILHYEGKAQKEKLLDDLDSLEQIIDERITYEEQEICPNSKDPEEDTCQESLRLLPFLHAFFDYK